MAKLKIGTPQKKAKKVESQSPKQEGVSSSADMKPIVAYVSGELETHKNVILSVATAVDNLDKKVKGTIEGNNSILIDQFKDINSQIESMSERIEIIDSSSAPCSCECKPEIKETVVKEVIVDERHKVIYENKELENLIKLNKIVMAICVIAAGISIFI